jgi:RNA polymerase sigma-70 factor (ECF subfamily)
MPEVTAAEIAPAFRQEYGRAVAAAIGRWPRTGPPPSPAGWIITTARQWDRGLIAEGQSLVRRCLRQGRPGPYQVQAAINAVHSDAKTASATDWQQILTLYDHLMTVAPAPVVALNRAVAVAEVHGPEAALALVDAPGMDGYHVYHAIRAALLRRLGRIAEAADAYHQAAARTSNAAEQDYLRRARAALTLPATPGTSRDAPSAQCPPG